MRKLRYVVAAFSLMFLLAGVRARAQASGQLTSVLSQMDAASTKFRSAEANFQWDFYERVTKSTSSQAGTIYFDRKNGKTNMGAKIATPSEKYLSYNDGLLQVFDPKVNTLLKAQAHGNQGQWESFLILGFGASGSDLAKAWNITDQGTETIDGISTVKLDLVSKDPNVQSMFTHITIWVDPARGISLKQMAYTPSDDVRTAIYKNIKYNVKVDAKPYEIKPNGKTSVTTR
ncbi:MAG TPA: outer membrane lipoprotein-sorting protein [Granulicella sp.]